jgi:DNA topoisomerase-1
MQSMGKSLVIVESPAKSRTLKKYLGKDFEVLASYGHVRDLVPKEGAVDTEADFAMRYQVIERNEKHVNAIAKAARKADALYLATDPDREGEAISWHLYQILEERGVLRDIPVHRVVFHEITKRAIDEAMAHPRPLAQELVDAQQARRALDYLVGFNLSPLLWKKVRRGLSAGRVQSPALRMIVEREEAIEAFVPREYWTLDADVDKDGQGFSARLTHLDGEKLDQFAIGARQAAEQVTARLAQAAAGALTVESIERKQRKRNPAAPFTTSTLQQEAARKLRFTTQRTMRTAQQLYEGIDIGHDESVGLITYMRTDSVNLAAEAIDDLRALIAARFGPDALPPQPRQYKTRSKNAQEAHEAVRPTAAERTPEAMKGHLSADQFKLYDLIWKRAVACQMQHATINTVAIDLTAGDGDRFRATGSIVVDPGFMAVYREDVDDGKDEADDEGRLLPAVAEGEVLALTALRPEQHFTEPPPRFSEASLVKTLEEFGIGRPSTYASIIKTLQDREYVSLEQRRFTPTDVGRVVSRMLTQHFSRYVDYDFTARLEDRLDAVARGEEAWRPLLKSFWEPFRDLVAEKDRALTRSDVTSEPLDEQCPKCGRPLVIRLGKRGRFVGCTGFNSDTPCDYTRDLGASGEVPEVEKVEGRSCPEAGCGGDLVVRSGRYGKFIGCSNYPTCRHMEPLERPRDTGIACPQCGKGTLMARKSRRGKPFFSCSTYPKCDYAVWNEPIEEPCPSCQWPILTLKSTRTQGTSKVCPQRECKFSEAVEKAEAE